MATSSKSIFGDLKCDPNLTPMLDVVFQLMTFFIMVMNFSADAFDERVRLPVAGSAQPVEGSRVDMDRLVLNIDRDGFLLFNDERLDTESAIREIGNQARLLRNAAKLEGRTIKAGEPLPTTLVIRSDQDTEFGQLFRLIKACQSNGFTKYALKAEISEGS